MTLAWQIAFIMIGRDPVRYRLIMLAAIVEKFSYFSGTFALYMQARAPQQILVSATIDLVLGILFVVSFIMTRESALKQ